MSRIYYLTIIKITGSFEGWVAGNGELYRYGNNAAGFYGGTSTVVFDSGQISINCSNSNLSTSISSTQTYNCGPWSNINVLFNRSASIGSGNGFEPAVTIGSKTIHANGSTDMGFLNFFGEQTVRFPLNGMGVTSIVKLALYRFNGSIKRIYFS